MKISGTFEILNTIGEVSSILNNMFNMRRCLPYLEEWDLIDYNKAKAVFRLKIGSLEPLVANVVITMESKEDGSFIFIFEGNVKGIEYRGRLDISLKSSGDSTLVSWEAVLELDRLLRILGDIVDIEELINNITKEAIRSFAECASRTL